MNRSLGSTVDRRTFLLASLLLGVRAYAQGAQLETFSQWLAASRQARDAGLQPCVDRIRSLDQQIQAWVQVSPEAPTGSGPLSGIPFGVKDIIETAGRRD
jgi:Asp-tRNA(Asn)/Glu-tRNA(Gln) amidotransferase A subunit family amidase